MPPLTLLLLACASLLVGPICGAIGARLRPAQSFVDGFALTLVGGLCCLFVLPHAMTELGVAGLGLVALGASLPAIGHRLWRHRSWSLGVVALVLGTHVVLDGAVLAVSSDHSPLTWAVVAHRLPVGFAIVLAGNAVHRSTRVAWWLAMAMVIATVFGFWVGPGVVAALPQNAPHVLEALIAGVLLHVVFLPHSPVSDTQSCDHGTHEHSNHEPTVCNHGHSGQRAHSHAPDHRREHHHGQPHDHHSHGHTKAPRAPMAATSAPSTWWAALGALSGMVALFVGANADATHTMDGGMAAVLRTLGVLVLESAPALLLGYGLAGLIPFLLTTGRMSMLGRGGRFMQSLRGVAFGLPLPVCSCGVLPLYESLIRRGAPPVAAMAFFIATPELGLDAILLSVPLLGGALTIARVVSAFAVALIVALLVGAQSSRTKSADRDFGPETADEPWPTRLRAGLRFGFVEVFDHTMPWIAIGLIIAAMAEPMLSHEAIQSVPTVIQVPVAALVGVPVYVCASGATPVAALALHKGLSSGAAIAFLIAGPATNVTTFGVLARLHGRRTALRFGAAVTGLAIACGWAVDALGVSAAPVLEAHTGAEAHASVFAWLCVAGLIALTVASLFRQGPRGALRQILAPIHAD